MLAATMFLTTPKLIVYAESGGKRRRVVVQWMGVGAEEKLPPATWAGSVRGEVDFQEGVEQSPAGSLMGFGR